MATLRLVEAITRLVRAFPPRNPLIIELNEALTEELSKPRRDVSPQSVLTVPISPPGGHVISPDVMQQNGGDMGKCPVCEARKDATRAAMAKARAARKTSKAPKA